MYRIITLFSILMLFMGNIASQNISYEKLWATVHENRNSKPRTALSAVNEIERLSSQEGNNVQNLCALLYEIDIKCMIDDSTIFSGVVDLETYYRTEKKPEVKAFAALSLSKLYDAYRRGKHRKINSVTTVVGDKRELKLDEWNSEMFEDTIRVLRESILADADELKKCLARNYEPMLNLGQDSRRFQPTLFDFFSYQLIEAASSIEEQNRYLQGIMDFHRQDKDPSAYLYAQLVWLKNQPENKVGSQCYHRALEQLLEQYKSYSASILIRADWANSLLDCKNKNCRTEDFDPEVPRKILSICQEGIDAFPEEPRINVLKSIQERVKEKSLSVEMKKTRIHSGENIKLYLHYANVENVKIELFACQDDSESSLFLPYRKKAYRRVGTWDFSLKKSNYFIPLDTIFELPAQDYGFYYLNISPQDKVQRDFIYFAVSDLYDLQTNLKGNALKGEYVVMDSKSGSPLESVAVKVFRGNGHTFYADFLTNKEGFAFYSVPERGNYSFLLSKERDRYYGECSHYFYSEREERPDPEYKYVSILTDRSIYRLGDKLLFKCLAYRIGEETRGVVSNERLKVTLYDVNQQVVAEKELETSELGSVWAEFSLPESGLPGVYRLQTEYGSANFRVESFKRPTFDVQLLKPEAAYSFGDSVSIKGVAKYLIGLPLNQAKVKFKVLRKMMRFPIFYFDELETFVAGGEVLTDENGCFELSFLAEKEANMKHLYYNYEVKVEVTDLAGETRVGKVLIPMGEKSVYFTFEREERMLFDDLDNIKIYLKNLDGVGLQGNVDYKVMIESSLVDQGTIRTDMSGKSQLNIPTDAWKSGKYSFYFSTRDPKDRVVEDSFEVVLYRRVENRPPVFSEIWVHNSVPQELNWDDSFDLEVGSSLKPAHLLCIVEDEHKIVDKHWYLLNDEIKRIPIKFKKENGKGLKIDLFLVHNGEKFHKSFLISKKAPSYDLPIKVKSFRDRLTPNTDEVWEFQLPLGGDSAEVLVAMYDASLDRLCKHDWMVNTTYPWQISYNHWKSNSLYVPNSFFWSPRQIGHGTRFNYLFDQLNEVANFGGYQPRMMMNFTKMRAAGAAVFASRSGLTAKQDADGVEERAESGEAVVTETATNTMSNEEFDFRQDFSSTAFFFPNLKPSSDGIVTVKFRSPELLTQWKFKLFVHSKSWQVGQLTQEVVTEKQLMIKPYMPRFVREGDEILLSAQVLNLSEKEQHGRVNLTIIDPLNNKIILEENVEFNAAANGDDLAYIRFQVPENLELLKVLWKVESQTHIDGEQSLLPILSNRTDVLVSLPIAVQGGASKSVRFDEFLNSNQETLRHRLYKVELLENPQWTVLQLLSGSAELSQSKGLSSLLYGYSTLMMSKKIVDSNPRIAEVIKLSLAQKKEQSLLTSNLERNEEVKNILLQETPWVMQVQNDNERMVGLAYLSDVNYVSRAQKSYWEKISSLQNEDGSFSWFEGMPGSLYMTSEVVSQMGHLKQLEAIELTDEVKTMLRKALRYIDVEENRYYKEMSSKEKREYLLRSSDLHYLYLRSQFPELSFGVQNDDAYRFYLSHLSEWKELSLRDRALAAVVAQREKKSNLAQTIVSSLLEYSTQSEEKGIYWQGSAIQCSYSPISLQTSMMEALYEVGCTTQQMDGMKTWLLAQKRVQSWNDEISSLDAAYAILLSGSDWVIQDSSVSVTLGGEPWNNISPIGYTSQTYVAPEITKELGEIKIENRKNSMVWASLYWQYSDVMNQVKEHQTDIQIKKQILVERITSKGVQLEPLSGKNVNVGDRLVARLVVRTQVDLDFVSLKDQLASCMEMGSELSGYRWNQGVGYYRSINDASVYYFFEHLPKGTYIFELPFNVTHSGKFFAGIASLQSLYAPDFSANSNGDLIVVEK